MNLFTAFFHGGKEREKYPNDVQHMVQLLQETLRRGRNIMKLNRELSRDDQIDALIAEHMMGWKTEWFSYVNYEVTLGKEGKHPFLRAYDDSNPLEEEDDYYDYFDIPCYTRSIEDAWDVLDLLRKEYYDTLRNGISVHLTHRVTGEEISVSSESIALAICIAALKTKNIPIPAIAKREK